MKLPRFHLGTLLFAVILLSAIAGANLYVRKAEVFHFTRTAQYLGAPVDELWRYHYCRTRIYFVGWPCAVSRNVADMRDSTVVYDPTSEQEVRELQALKNMNFREWDGESFRNLAPTIYKNFPALPEMDYVRAASDWLFRKDANCDFNAPAVALNAAIAFAITLALAAAFEIFLRRQTRSAHP